MADPTLRAAVLPLRRRLLVLALTSASEAARQMYLQWLIDIDRAFGSDRGEFGPPIPPESRDGVGTEHR